MVYSNIDKSIDYKESKNIDSSDINNESNIYYGELFKKSINFIVGNANYSYIDKNIIFFNIYLINKDKLISRIGVYEIVSEKYSYVFDDDNNINFEYLNKPIIFKFVNRLLNDKYIYDNIDEQEKLEEEVDKDDELQTDDEDRVDSEGEEQDDDLEKEDEKYISNSPEKSIDLSPLKLQTQEEAEEEKRIFKDDETNLWIEKFMKNNNYSLIDNEGGGDCLFAVIRDGLSKINKKITVKELRARLANEATQEIFENYKLLYNKFLETYRLLTLELKELKTKNEELRAKTKDISTETEKKEIIKQASKISKRYKQAQDELSLTKQLLKEYMFMKNVSTLSDFKKLINSCDFWAETWAISTLERILNIKLIILSSQQYREKDFNNVLQCGQLNDKVLEERGSFNPNHYIIIDYTGDHYKLISYKKRGALTFIEIPYDIKELIVNKCMERQGGPFYIIPEFKEFAELLKYNVADVDDLDAQTINDLYDKDIVFQFYSRSNGKPLPGKGNGESISADKVKDFSDLAKISDWRKKLSNFWNNNPINIDGLTWASVEHYYQANKFKNDNPDFYKLFSIESGSEISKDPEYAKAAGGKTGKLGTKVLRHKKILMDSGFMENSDKIMEKAMYAKFTQHQDLRDLLIATRNAKLVHFVRASPPVVFDNLMRVRKAIMK